MEIKEVGRGGRECAEVDGGLFGREADEDYDKGYLFNMEKCH